MYTCSYYDKFWNFKYYKPTYAPAPYVVLTFDRIISLSFFLQFSLRKALIHSADGIWEFCINKTKLMNNQPNSLNEINWFSCSFQIRYPHWPCNGPRPHVRFTNNIRND
jgi:hypothetical protein